MKAIFSTEKVKYEVSESGYSRNGHSVQADVILKELTIGQPAVIEVKTNGYEQLIRTDIVNDIELCPAYFKMKMKTEVHPYKITMISPSGTPLVTMRIGTAAEVEAHVKKMYPNEKVNYQIAPIPTKNRSVS